MKCNLIVQTNELTVRDYTIVEDEGMGNLLAGAAGMGNPGLVLSYEGDEENPGKNMIIIAAQDLPSILKFLDFAELPVRILM